MNLVPPEGPETASGVRGRLGRCVGRQGAQSTRGGTASSLGLYTSLSARGWEGASGGMLLGGFSVPAGMAGAEESSC